MTHQGLNKNLKRFPVPEPDATARSRALSHALLAFENREAATPTLERRNGLLLWPVGCALAMLLVFCALRTDWFGSPHRALSDLLVLDEMSTLFDHRLIAVVEREGKVDLQLSAQDVPVSQQPVRILLSRGEEVVRILSFSGREVCLDLDGKKTSLDVLTTKDGEVMIVGVDFFWNRQNPASLAGYRIEATALPPAS